VTLVAMCSLGGAPGVTTAAVAVADRWPGRELPVLVECDPAGGDLLARFRLPPAPGLVSLAAAARRHGGDPGLLWRHTQTLPGGLPVVAGPVGAEQAHAALGELTAAGAPVLRRAADSPHLAAVADCGRLGPGSPAAAVVAAADTVLVLARARDDQLAHVAAGLPRLRRWAGRPCFLVLVGDGYPTEEVARALDAIVLGRLPDDPAGAAVACGRDRTRSGPSRTRLGRAAAGIAGLAASHARAARPRAAGRGARPRAPLGVFAPSRPPLPPTPAGRAHQAHQAHQGDQGYRAFPGERVGSGRGVAHGGSAPATRPGGPVRPVPSAASSAAASAEAGP
jgi:hypothetical protein